MTTTDIARYLAHGVIVSRQKDAARKEEEAKERGRRFTKPSGRVRR